MILTRIKLSEMLQVLEAYRGMMISHIDVEISKDKVLIISPSEVQDKKTPVGKDIDIKIE